MCKYCDCKTKYKGYEKGGVTIAEGQYSACCIIQPTHCKFKDGDIIADSYFDTICIFKGEGSIKGTVDFYCGINDYGEIFIKDIKDQDEHFGEIEGYNFVTEEEKQKLFDAIKANGYKWNAETKTLEKLIEPKFKVGDRIRLKNGGSIIEVTSVNNDSSICVNGMSWTIKIKQQDNYELVPDKFDITTLKPFDKVLVRDCNEDKWNIDFFGYYRDNGTYQCMTFTKNQCIPYDSNKELLGTTNDCDNYYKTW